ncbi:MAG: CHAT domain-containing protein, partial [Pyrinomonadaceae bacterium]
YKGVAPINAVGAIDKALDYWISEAGNRGMISGDLGTLFFVPTFNNNRVAAKAVLLGGMGEYGKFDYYGLCYMVMNIAFGISQMKLKQFASVLMGAGDGNLSLEQAIKGLLSGICDGLHHQLPGDRTLEEYILVELKDESYQEILKVLQRYASQNVIENLKIEVREGDEKEWLAPEIKPEQTKAESDKKQPSFEGPPPASKFVNKITITQGAGGFEFAAMTDKSVIPVSNVRIQPFFTESIAERLRRSDSLKDQKEFGELLHMYVFPEKFEKWVADKKITVTNTARPAEGTVSLTPLTLILDNTTAALPWEMACMKDPDGNNQDIYFGRHLQLSRQFRTTLSGSPGISPPVNTSLRILIIADPAPPESKLNLKGAREEGAMVKELFESFKEKYKGVLDIEIDSFIGSDECNPIEIIRRLYHKPYDILHYTGHGMYNAAEPDLSGWVFGPKIILSAREIFRARRVARLVFANACFTSVVTSDNRIKIGRNYKPSKKKNGKVETLAKDANGDWRPAEETNRSLAGLAEAFFERGVENYIGAGWKVHDDSAPTFAKAFYEKIMEGEFLGDALAEARNKIYDDDTSDWGAYQHYGQPNTRMVPLTLKRKKR